jgi:hypothetical protein
VLSIIVVVHNTTPDDELLGIVGILTGIGLVAVISAVGVLRK